MSTQLQKKLILHRDSVTKIAPQVTEFLLCGGPLSMRALVSIQIVFPFINVHSLLNNTMYKAARAPRLLAVIPKVRYIERFYKSILRRLCDSARGFLGGNDGLGGLPPCQNEIIHQCSWVISRVFRDKLEATQFLLHEFPVQPGQK
jgi:hypothetical protein